MARYWILQILDTDFESRDAGICHWTGAKTYRVIARILFPDNPYKYLRVSEIDVPWADNMLDMWLVIPASNLVHWRRL